MPLTDTYPFDTVAETCRSFLREHTLLRRLLHPVILLARFIHAIVLDYRIDRKFSRDDRPLDPLRRVGHVARIHLAQPRTVLFYPEVPNHRYMIRKVLTRLGVAVTNDPDAPAFAAVLWKDATTVDAEEHRGAFHSFQHVINVRCTDITKSHVGTCFRSVFGYRISVDPCRYGGPIVEKSEQNALHDGRTLTGPISNPDPEKAYQRLIDNAMAANICVDYRVPIINGTIPTIFLRFRRQEERFESNFLHSAVVDVDDTLTTHEQQKLLTFAQRMGLDYGELDVVRDRSDDRIYVVDCNKTPWGGRMLSSKTDRARAVEEMMPAVNAMIGGGH